MVEEVGVHAKPYNILNTNFFVRLKLIIDNDINVHIPAFIIMRDVPRIILNMGRYVWASGVLKHEDLVQVRVASRQQRQCAARSAAQPRSCAVELPLRGSRLCNV